MTTAIDYEANYEQALNREYEKIISDLELIFRKKDDVSKKEKLLHFRNETIRKSWSLKEGQNEQGKSVEDKFLAKLIHDFKSLNTKYDDFPIKNFLIKDVPILKQDFKDRNEKILNEIIFNGSEVVIINFLAENNALEKFNDDSRDVSPTKEDTIEQTIRQIRLGRHYDEEKLNGEKLPISNFKFKSSDYDLLNNYNIIEWEGTQKQLAELFVELKKKGWIKEINVNQIKSNFTKSKTIEQVLKPHYDSATKENLYSEIYTAKYPPKFDKIKAK